MFKRVILQGMIAILLSAVLAACGGGDDDAPASQAPSSPPPPATAASVADGASAPTTAAPAQAAPGGGRSITIINGDVGGPTGKYEFVPNDLNFKVGETVNLILQAETEFHTFTVDELDIDASLDAGDTVTLTYTFDKPGTFELVCLVHESNGMTGTITVQ